MAFPGDGPTSKTNYSYLTNSYAAKPSSGLGALLKPGTVPDPIGLGSDPVIGLPWVWWAVGLGVGYFGLLGKKYAVLKKVF